MSLAVPERGFPDSMNYTAIVRPGLPFLGSGTHNYAGLPCAGDDSVLEYDTNLHS